MLLLLERLNPSVSSTLSDALSPGAAVLAKWLPIFFVPSLVTLPLAPKLGSAMEAIKMATVILGGFYFTLLTTAWSVLGVRKLGGSDTSTSSTSSSSVPSSSSSSLSSKAAAPLPFSAQLFQRLTCGAVVSGILASLGSSSSSITRPLQSLCMLCATLSSFVFGARLPKSFTKIVHPLVTCTTLTWVAATILGQLVHTPFLSMLANYRSNTLTLTTLGAGDALLFMLGPAVVALATQMYSRRTLMRQNWKEVITAVLGSSVGGLFGTAALVRVLSMTTIPPAIRLSLLSRNITSPLAMAIAGILNADASIAVSAVVISGLIGANFGASILNSFGIQDPVARGLGIGAAAHGLGTAAFAEEKDAFPFAAIAMALTASCSTVLVSVPQVKSVLLKLALG